MKKQHMSNHRKGGKDGGGKSGRGRTRDEGAERRSYSVPRAEIDRLIGLTHHDPHSILGAHDSKDGIVVRAFRPKARSITLLPDVGTPVPMDRLHEDGLFEVLLEGRHDFTPYRLEVRYSSSEAYTIRDPYAYMPTMGDLDLHLLGEGRHHLLYERLGAHVRDQGGVRGVSFAVWAPNARGVSVVGGFNGWDGRLHQMRQMGSSGIWEIFLPDLEPGALYKYEVRPREGPPLLKADPVAFYSEVPPKTASRVHRSGYAFKDDEWMEARREADHLRAPLAVYEIHHGSWKRVAEEGGRPLTYREMAESLADYAKEMGFTHVEFLPIMEHPFAGSWGYQSTGYFAPTSRYGSPDDFRFLVDHLHRNGIGVILDWAPAHFPNDEFALGRFDGTALYEHADPKEGYHPDWGTFVFNYGRNEVRNFLKASALFWLKEFHVDGLRVDAVASMIYRDYSRKEGEWIPNVYGGRENLEAISLIKELNEVSHGGFPGAMMIAEESTAWPGVSRPTYLGGLGFTFKWNMGWMHDTLEYFSKPPVFRRYHHNHLTFGFLYAWSENFILPLSHDEVVHGKGSLLGKMPGEGGERTAGLRALYGYMWAHPGKKLLFMGGEFAQPGEWGHEHSLDWHLLSDPRHEGVRSLVRDLNRAYRNEPALWESDTEPEGFEWIDAGDVDGNVISFIRKGVSGGRKMICICNFSGAAKHEYRIGLPEPGQYTEIVNTDSEFYGGGGMGNRGGVTAEEHRFHGRPYSALFTLPPLTTIWLRVPE